MANQTKAYTGKYGSGGTQVVDAPYKHKGAKPGKKAKGKDLRSGKK